jgi:hypothetical protein
LFATQLPRLLAQRRHLRRDLDGRDDVVTVLGQADRRGFTEP